MNSVRVLGSTAYVLRGNQGISILDIGQFVSPSLEMAIGTQGPELLLHGTSGGKYVLESTKALPAAGAWTVETNVLLTVNQMTLSNVVTSATEHRFFRVRSEEL